MKKKLLVAGMLALVTAVAQADTLYRWVDSEGKVHYGDKPAEDATEIEQKKFATPTVSDDDFLSYEARRARQNFPVTLYVSEDCGGYCKQARDFLNKRGIPFGEKLLVTKEDVDEYKKLTGGNSVPAVTIGKTFLNGFEAVQWGAELDIAGYPKEAPYGARPRLPTPAPTPASAPEAAAPAVEPAMPTE